MPSRISEAELRAIYNATVDSLYGYASRKCGGERELAEDVTQEVWLRAVREWPRTGAPDNPIAWLTTVARNLLINHYKKKQGVSLDSISPDEFLAAVEDDRASESAEVASVMTRAMSLLPQTESELLEAFHFERKKMSQLATLYGTTERAIEGRLRRARAVALRDYRINICREIFGMNDNMNEHLPTPEFRASLEREVIQAFRRESPFSMPPSAGKRARLRTAATLALGLSLGVGGAVATAQVQEGRQRNELVQSAGAEWQLLTLRWHMAELMVTEVKRAVDAGARSSKDLRDAELEFRAVQTAVQKFNLRQEELRISGLVARDELWAPLVGKRDFVSERLKADADWANAQLEASEQNLQTSRQRVAAGLTRADDVEALEIEQTQREREQDLEFVGQKLTLRREYLSGTKNQTALATELQLMNIRKEMVGVLGKMAQAKRRAENARLQQKVGSVTLLDVKRAELEELKNSMKSDRLKLLLDSIQRQKEAQAPKKKP